MPRVCKNCLLRIIQKQVQFPLSMRKLILSISVVIAGSLLLLAAKLPSIFAVRDNRCPHGCDAIRIADLSQIQTALDLFFKKCGIYPGGTPAPDSNPACGISQPSQLVGPLLGISKIPRDPSTGSNYFYCYIPGGASYALQTNLEDLQKSALAQSLAVSPAGCTNTSGAVTCDKSKGEYCVGP